MTENGLAAVIDIGASAMRLVIAEMGAKGVWKRLDRAVKPVSLGRDVFRSGRISRETSLRAIEILRGFTELLAGWNIPPENTEVIATSAVREAKNQAAFIARVFSGTTLRIHVLDEIEENRLTCLAVRHAVRGLRSAVSNTLIIEAGAGTTTISILRRGKIESAYSFHFGALRMGKYLDPDSGNYAHLEGSIGRILSEKLNTRDTASRFSRVNHFAAVGSPVRIAAEKAGMKVKENYALINRKNFLNFAAYIQSCGAEECVRMLQITPYEAEGLVPSLIIYKYFLERTSAKNVLFPDVSIREGVLLNFVPGGPVAVKGGKKT
jgi:exopolyphosphatase/guanosine-5'-triphosphate,3'-diphosphate pyrophosphatase